MFQHVPNKVDQDQAGDPVEQVHEDEELQLEEDEEDISLVVHPGYLGELDDVEEPMEVLDYLFVLFAECFSIIVNIFLHC